MLWRRHIYRFEVLKLHGSEVMMSTRLGVKVVSVQVAHVGTSFEVPCLGYLVIETLIGHQSSGSTYHISIESKMHDLELRMKHLN